MAQPLPSAGDAGDLGLGVLVDRRRSGHALLRLRRGSPADVSRFSSAGLDEAKVFDEMAQQQSAFPATRRTVSKLAYANNESDTLLPGQFLHKNQMLVSKDGSFKFGFDSSSSFGIWLVKCYDELVWQSDKKYSFFNSWSASLTLSENGTLLLLDSDSLIWSNHYVKKTSVSVVLVLLDIGNLVVRDKTNDSLVFWQSSDYPTNTILPGGGLGFNKITGKNTSLISPSSYYTLELDTRRRGFIIRDIPRGSMLSGNFPSWMKIREDGTDFVMLYDAQTYLRLEEGGLFTTKPVDARSGLIIFSYAQMKNVTKNFSEKLGEGGFGSVFKGTLLGYSGFAVKYLKCVVQVEKQFRAEVQTIGMIQHINLVRLLGFCAEERKRLLVYEYMPNGSLSSHLFSESSEKLCWKLRYLIALGTARGLAYLHEECKDCIVHCDMKPDNVLLDTDFCPKIADFGMAKLLNRDFSRALTTMRGTIGYLAPEWISGLPITHKADVYSYGMMLLEIISGRRNSEKIKEGKHTYFPIYAACKLNEDDAMCLLDSRLEGNSDAEQLERACRIACWCIQDAEDQRPTMGQVVLMLEDAMDVLVPPIPRSLQNFVGLEDHSTDLGSS
uniref:non-specific serine/threonine protein kinase n=1 Tax=Leersia perrieri TaxID=77586 RepID=A0A0D9UYF3_9ORYZ